MSDEKKKALDPARSIESDGDVRSHPETNFLPPLRMVLTFLDRNKKVDEAKQESSNEKAVEKLIEKLSEKEE
jgi:hypothetical protein